MTLSVFTSAQIIAQLDSQFHWAGSTISYSTSSTTSLIGYVSSGRDLQLENTTYTPLNAAQASAATLAITLWGDLMPLTLVTVNEAAGINANIDFAAFKDAPANGDYAYALPRGFYNPDGVTGTLTKASVWVNDSFNASAGYISGDLSNPAVGNYAFLSFVHELGHAMGLNHMGNYNGTAGSGPSSYQDSLVYSVMSYYGPNSGLGGQALGVAWANWGSWDPQTPMIDDVLAIQSMYGISTTSRVGNTVYGFGSNVAGTEAAIYDFGLNAHPIMCIFDSSGNDTLSLSGDSNNDTIDLRSGYFSSVMGLTYNVSIAYSCTIENAVGGSGNDTIIGNNAGNILSGGAGIDTIIGGSGNDNIVGGAGADAMDGGGGSNFANYYDSALGVTVNLFSGTGTGGDAQGDTLVNIQNLVGSTHDDMLIGDNNANVIWGNGGNDTLLGYGGNDTILGGSGNDNIVGGAGADAMDGGGGSNFLNYYDSAAGVGINLINGYAGGGDAQGDTFVNFQNIIGSAFNDILIGDSNANIIIGGAGNDLIYGGGGNEAFVYAAPGFGKDEIGDFTIGQDHIQIATSLAANFASLSIVQVGSNTLVTIGQDSIQLDSIIASSLHASDFVFV